MHRTINDADIVANLAERIEAHGRSAPSGQLNAVERQIVALARFDPISSLRPLRRHERLVAWVFGVRQPNQLADPGLEALRRFAVLQWKKRNPDPDAFLKAGYSISHARAVHDLVESARAGKAGRTPWVPGLVAAATVGGVASILHGYFGDWLIALFLGIVVLLSATPLFARSGASPA